VTWNPQDRALLTAPYPGGPRRTSPSCTLWHQRWVMLPWSCGLIAVLC